MNHSQSIISVTAHPLQNASGAIPYGMTNDYMFRAVLQTNNKVLRGLVSALLHLKEEEILSVEITNPVILGNSPEKKEIRLDINVVLNNHTFINLEMQVANQLNWNDRSLLYLCRSFDSLHRGEAYGEVHPVIHIGFLDYPISKEYPEFYATYKLLNVKTHQNYNDNFMLSVVDLTHIDLATKEDREYHIDCWAALFKAATWEEIAMLAVKDEYIREASHTMFELSADEQIRKQCRDREEYYQDLRRYEKAIVEKDAQLQKIVTEKDAQLQKIVTEKDAQLHRVSVETERLRALLKQHGIDDSE